MLRRGLLPLLTLLFQIASANSPLFAFHDGGVGSCSGCHAMHVDPLGVTTVSEDGALLIASSASDVCLSCHAEAFGEVLGDDPLRPPPEKGAGNFVFLLEDNLNDGTYGAIDPIHGEAAGHNVVAPGYGLLAEQRWEFSPGGNFPSNRLECTSCHDPHGTAAFRMLLGAGPVNREIFTFSAPAPRAEGIDPSTEVESDANHSAYQGGMSAWCGNCHGLYHAPGLSEFEHPTDVALDMDTRMRYDEYLGDDFPEDGVHGMAYLPAVPFEDPTATTGSRQGPSTASRIMCLTCHRAHGSSAPGAGRWDPNIDLLHLDGTVSGSWPIPDPYDSLTQGSLCSKCHYEPQGPSDPLDEAPEMTRMQRRGSDPIRR